MRSRLLRIVAALLTLTLIAAACGSDESNDEAVTETPAAESTSEEAADQPEAEVDEAPGTIVDVAVANGSFTTLVAAAQAAGLVETLSGDGPFTVFAPTDDAFAAALEALGLTAEDLLGNTELLTSVLTYHVIAGEVPASQVLTMDGQSAATVNGAEVTITIDGDTVMVNDATVIAVDVEASNGIIHVIDSVLLPPS
jgi:transforming growth factor-beta-induced protein